jgi:hypothetical protein
MVTEISDVANRYFIKQLCNNINEYSKKYDIIDLVSCFYDCKMSVPLVISTLTRKFYLTPNNERQHYLSIIPGDQEGLFKLAIQLRKIFNWVIYNTASGYVLLVYLTNI